MTGQDIDKRLVRRTFSVELEAYRDFEVLAKENDLSAAWLIRKAMEEFLHNVRSGRRVALRSASEKSENAKA